jgi:8-oxo-dGDP phosphatase
MQKKTSDPRVEYRNRFWKIHHVHADYQSYAKDYYIIELGPRAGVVMLRDGCVLLTKQFRFLIDRFSWELPGGGVDAGETAEQAAQRECTEETGYRCSNLRKIAEYYPGLDNFNNRTTVYVSTTIEQVAEFSSDPAEVVEIRWFPLAEALRMAAQGEILDGMTVVGLFGHIALAGNRQQ